MRKPEQLHLTPLQEMLCGIITGITQVTITTPYEFVKIRCQLSKGKVSVSPFTVIKENSPIL